MASFSNRLDLLYVLALTQLKTRYKKAVLGYVWSLANPLVFAAIFYFVFGIVMKSGRPDMPAFLLTGLFPWQWISNSLSGSTMVFIGNAALVKKVAFPRYFLPLSLIAQDAWHFIMALPVLASILAVSGFLPHWGWLWALPLCLVIQAVLLFGLAMLLASLNMFLRDIEHLVQVMLMVGFYATPVIYPLEQVPEPYADFIRLNPFTSVIGLWREVIYTGTPKLATLAIAIPMALTCLAVGAIVYRGLSRRFAELI
ncbi:MAG TPA: ABC transporter permease [Patescibacteria group bacterium]|nr:ABC transporter permease [Patescibacteria group bacterium]